MNRDDSVMRARVAGKQAIQERKIWELEIADLRVRCLASEADPELYELQALDAKGVWQPIQSGKSPAGMLQGVTTGGVFWHAIGRAVRRAGR